MAQLSARTLDRSGFVDGPVLRLAGREPRATRQRVKIGTGEAVIIGAQPFVHANDNSKVCLTQQLPHCPRSRPIELFETSDPCDRAHKVRAGSMFVNAADLPRQLTKARQYPRSSMLASGVSIDSSFDWLHAAQRRLEGVPGVGRTGDTAAEHVREALDRLPAERVRNITRRELD